MQDPQTLFGDLPAAGGHAFHLFRIAFVDGVQHLQNLHIMARRAHARVVRAWRMGNGSGVDQVVVIGLINILHASGGEQHFRSPGDVLMAQTLFKAEALLFDKGMAIDVQPRHVQELARFERHLQPGRAVQHVG